MREREDNYKALDERCAKLFASYRCLMLLTDRESGELAIRVPLRLYARH